jgi:RHS repeat-associated protein
MGRLAWRHLKSLVAVSAVLAVIVPAFSAASGASASVPPPAYKGRLWSPFPLPRQASVPGRLMPRPGPAAASRLALLEREAVAREPGARRAVLYHAPRGQRWPSAGSGSVLLWRPAPTMPARQAGRDAPVPALRQVGTLPVAVASVRPGYGPASVHVQLESQAVAAAAGIHGVVLAVTAGLGSSGGPVRVALAYSRFAGMYGGGWATRLRFVRLPACALTSPGRPGCREQVVLRGASSTQRQMVSAVAAVPSPAAGAPAQSAGRLGGLLVLALVSGPSGPDGNFTATPLRPSGTWTAQQGSFTYTYPVQVPPSLGGSAPAVALSYDSQSIDSETSGSNTQAGWIGDGWDYSPGFIERSYQPCSQDGIAGSGDECWGGWNATMQLGGRSDVLVRDDSGTWHLRADDKTQVQLLPGASNGLWKGEYWLVTTPDGTQYYFGQNHLPGGTGIDPATNSAWGVPVYCPGTTDPCNSSSAPEQTLGWRWNLDYVVDPLGNLTVYDYQKETNYYSMGGGQNNGNGTLTQYVRGGFLKTISYGWQLHDALVAGTEPADQIRFTSSQRCTGTASECSSYSNLNSSDAADWPDTPFDMICQSTGTCTNYSPTYFSTYMLTEIDTLVLEGSGTSAGYKNVDTYNLSQSFPAAGTAAPVIFLNSVTRTGDDGGSLGLPALTFTPAETDNRVAGLVPAAPQVYRPRIAAIATGTGGVITITYAPPQCSRLSGGTMPSSPQANTLACFPVFWSPPGSGQIQDWFTKSLVSQVDTSDQTTLAAPSPDQVTSYSYLDGAAWHHNDSPLVTSANRTWDQYRGFGQVQVETGAAPDPVTKVLYTYFQGMDGDNNGSGGTKSVQVQDSLNESYIDRNWLAGRVLETDTYTQAGSPAITSKVINAAPTSEWSFTQTASQTEPGGLPALTAQMLSQAQVRTMQAVAAGGYRTSTVTTYYNGDARVTQTDNAPAGSAETCTTTDYATAPAGNPMMLDYPDEVTTVTGAYSGTGCPAKTAANIVSDKQSYYDHKSATLTSLGTLGSLTSPGGLVTGTRQAADWPSTGESFQPMSVAGYDNFGRVTSATDGDGNTTTTAYATSATSAGNTTELPTSVTVTKPAPFSWKTTTRFDQGREQATEITDVNSEKTTQTYDPLGRLLTVTVPIDQGSGDATYKYSYNLNASLKAGTPPAVTTQTLQESGAYGQDIKIYDGMLQLREEQSMPYSSPGRLVTDSFYDSHGWAVKTSGPYFNNADPGPDTTPVLALDSNVPNQTVTVYDGEGRPTASQFYSLGTLQWQTTTAYPGLDQTDTTPPSGAAPSSAFTNAAGQTTASWRYTTATPDGKAADADKTSYTYTPAGQVSTIADNNGNTWTYGYNLLGENTSSTDPGTLGSSGPSRQAGTTTYTYDPAGHLASTTSPSGQELSYAYDALGRKTAEYSGSTSGTQIASWSYDQAPLYVNGVATSADVLGQLSSSTATPGGASGPAYTETITGYTTAYEPAGASETLPHSALVPGASGTSTYSTTSTYTTLTGEPATTTYNADNGLPAETVSYSFDAMGQETQIGGAATYLAGLAYDAWGNPHRVTMGPFPDQLAQTYTRDPATQRLLEAQADFETLKFEPDATSYTYDKAGQVTSVSDVQDAGQSDAATQTQCLRYGGSGELATQLTAAWTDTGGTQTAASPIVPGIGGCVHTSPAAATIGGPAPYWETWTNDLAGDRTSQATYNTSLPASQDTLANATVQQTTYPGGNLSNSPASNAPATQQAQPDAAQAVTTTSPSATKVTADSYDANGGAIARRDSGPGPLISAEVPSTGRLCADDFNFGTADGTKVDLAACTGAVSQTWTTGTDGTVKVQGKCLTVHGNGTTAATLVEIDSCTTASGQKWQAAPSGALVNPNSGMCLDDPGGTKTTGTQLDIAACNGWPRQEWATELFTYTPQHQVATVTSPAAGGAQTAAYAYDTSGSLIAQADPAANTIYLLGGTEQISYDPSSKVTTAQRIYTAPDGTAAVRTHDSTSKAGVDTISYLAPNAQGTAIESVSTTGTITRRYFDPYGQPVGPVPSWPDNHGFVGQPADSFTSLDLLGARQYDPATGAFLSLDPVFQSGNPLAMGGYAYADNNPLTYSDPSGMQGGPWINTGNCIGSIQYCEHHDSGGGGVTSTGTGSSTGTSTGGGGPTITGGPPNDHCTPMTCTPPPLIGPVSPWCPPAHPNCPGTVTFTNPAYSKSRCAVTTLSLDCEPTFTVPRDSHIYRSCDLELVGCPQWFLNEAGAMLNVIVNNDIYTYDHGSLVTNSIPGYSGCGYGNYDLSGCPRSFNLNKYGAGPSMTWSKAISDAYNQANASGSEGPSGGLGVLHTILSVALSIAAGICDGATEGACSPLDPEILSFADYLNTGYDFYDAIQQGNEGQ